MQAQVQCYAFEPYSYVADSSGRTFDEMFDWDLFRWYYQRNLNPQLDSEFQTYFEPLYSDLDNSFMFRIADEGDLSEIKQWKKEKTALIKNYIEDKRDHFWGNEEREESFNKSYEELYENAKYEYDIQYEDYDIQD